MHSSHHDHSNYTGEEENDHETVYDRKVVDLIIWVSLEIDIPPMRPFDLNLLPFDIVRINDFFLIALNCLERVGVILSRFELITRREDCFFRIKICLCVFVFVFDRERNDLEPHNALAIKLLRNLRIFYYYSHMIE